jgi:hypothetical protein
VLYHGTEIKHENNLVVSLRLAKWKEASFLPRTNFLKEVFKMLNLKFGFSLNISKGYEKEIRDYVKEEFNLKLEDKLIEVIMNWIDKAKEQADSRKEIREKYFITAYWYDEHGEIEELWSREPFDKLEDAFKEAADTMKTQKQVAYVDVTQGEKIIRRFERTYKWETEDEPEM